MILNRHGAIEIEKYAVDVEKHICHRCHNNSVEHFYRYYSPYYKDMVTYCLNCVTLGAMTNRRPLNAIEIEREAHDALYHLKFELTSAQQSASDRIVNAFLSGENVLLHAVTGAGKTEITFEVVHVARQKGKRVAYVAPRIDVVKEIYLRLTSSFTTSRIDLKYDGVKIEFEHQFVVCTIQQLYNYRDHFDLIIVDETDAFPLTTDEHLMGAIRNSASDMHSIVFMTATPNSYMKKHLGNHREIHITKRYHGFPLAKPNIIYQNVLKDIRKKRANLRLIHVLKTIVDADRKVLVFVPEIKLMLELETILKETFHDIKAVSSKSEERYRCIDLMRDGELQILLTTTILERGVTFSMLDVIVVGAEQYDESSLIQICGRVGRKLDDPVGNIYFLTEYNTKSILGTIRYINECNRGVS